MWFWLDIALYVAFSKKTVLFSMKLIGCFDFELLVGLLRMVAGTAHSKE